MGDIFDELRSKWKSAVVARTQVDEFSGGLLNPKSMANMDSAGLGPTRITVGRKVAYPTEDLIQWMRARKT